MAQTPVFATTPHVEMAQVNVANTARDGSGTVVTCFTTGANGSRIERVRIKVVNNSTANMLRFFLYDGTNTRLIRETTIIALSPSATVQTFEGFETFGMILPSGWQLRASINTSAAGAEIYNIITEGADL